MMRIDKRLCLLPAVVVAVMLGRPVTGRQASQAPAHAAGKTQASAETLEQQAAGVAREVEQLRGWQFKGPVRTERASPAEARHHLEAAFDTEYPATRLEPLEALMRLTGLLPSDADYRSATLTMLESQVAGFYDPDAKALFLVEQPGAMPRFVAETILAHELTHALDDQAFDLARFEKAAATTQDARLVTAALTEGSAAALMIHFATRRLVAGQVDPGELKAYLAQEMERAKLLETMPRGLNTLFASYICGAAFLTRKDLVALQATDERQIGENLTAAMKDPPRTSEQIVHPEKYWDPARRDEPVLVDDRSVERWLVPSGRRITFRDTLGELQTAVLTEPRDFPKDLGRLMSATAWTNPGAIGWGGDRFYLLAPAAGDAQQGRAGGAAGLWVTAWDTAGDRDEFLRALEKGYAAPDRAAARLGRLAAVVFFGLPVTEREGLTAGLGNASFKFTKAGKPWRP